MGSNSSIQWTDHTVNFWTGCTKVSPGCKFCYMYRDKERYGLDPTTVLQVKQGHIQSILRKAKPGDKIFTCSWSDFFIEDADQWRNEAWDIIRERDDLIWQILTKRPDRIKECLPSEGLPKNIWLGVSVETQDYVVPRIVAIKDLPCVRFVSVEPMIGMVDLTYMWDMVDWVIVGGESGNDNGKYKYRQSNIDWYYNIVSGGKLHNTPVFVKQLGTHLAKKMGLKDRHGGDWNEWPEHLRIRQFPKSKNHTS